MNSPRGSLWRKWDLHVHTPYSIHQQYGHGENDEIWERYISDLENLPTDFKVLGINDYIFLDGYKKVIEYKNHGRLQNIDLLLPVIELRLDKFGGTEGHWSKVNFHIIFSNLLTADVIESQFLSQLSQGYTLSPHVEGDVDWAAVPTRESLKDLGEKIINSVPDDKKPDYQSPLIEGFNNLNYDFDYLITKLRNNTYLKGKYFTAIGKTEWASILWTDQSIAEKKKVINGVDFVFISSYSPQLFYTAKASLLAQAVNDRILDCSDAHYFSNSSEKDKIGKCFTWIRADTTFEGLRQILYEPERIFIGDIPEKVSFVNSNKTKFIKSVEIRKKKDSKLTEEWFDLELALNSDLVAVIGNRGSGKSALLDVIGLTGNTHVEQKHLPFLDTNHFQKDRKATNFEAVISWESGDRGEHVSLDSGPNILHEELVRYIPQNYFEEICNQLSDTTESGAFYQELGKVIFSHVKESKRLGKENLDDLISYSKVEIVDAINSLKLKINEVNEKISILEEKLRPEYKDTLRKKIKQKEKEIRSLSKPDEVAIPERESKELENISLEINNLNKNIKKNVLEQDELSKNLIANNKLLSICEKLQNRVSNLQSEFDHFISESKGDFETLGIEIEDVVEFSISVEPLQAKINTLEKNVSELEARYDEIDALIQDHKNKIKDLEIRLDEPNRQYQEYVTELRDWEEKTKELTGDPQTPDTLEYFKNQLKELDELPIKLASLEDDRFLIAGEIFSKKEEIAEIYRRLYSPVQEFIERQELGDEFKLQFSVSILPENFKEQFFKYINHGASGSFIGVEAASDLLDEILSGVNFNNKEQVMDFISLIINHLKFDKRSGYADKERNISNQLKGDYTKTDVYNFLFSLAYLAPRYTLKLADRDMQQLSPGEKGTLLLIFYLMIDKDRIPLIIDQPEHNLDNQTVYKLLVEAVKHAKNYRQIIIVTHNPNLAVVCDAEQVICASIDKTNNKINYVSGAIENPKINKQLLDILEGTKPAFDQRRFKYLLDYYDVIE